MIRRVIVGVTVTALMSGACGLGERQAQADRIINAGEALMRADSVPATVSATVRLLPVERQVVEVEPPRIAAGRVTDLGATLHPRTESASVANSVVFIGSAMYERIAPKTVSALGQGAVVVPSNLNAIFVALRGGQLQPVAAEPVAATASTTTTTPTTSAPRLLRRTVQIVREWAAFDFADIEDRDSTKHGGSLAINPVALLRLTTGVLTGSIERRSATVYEANVSRDKAERDLSEDEREVLDKMFTANAVSRRVFPAVFRLDQDGSLAAFEVTLRQQLSSKDRADLTVGFAFRSAPEAAIPARRPDRRGTVSVRSLGQLVTTVSGL